MAKPNSTFIVRIEAENRRTLDPLAKIKRCLSRIRAIYVRALTLIRVSYIMVTHLKQNNEDRTKTHRSTVPEMSCNPSATLGTSFSLPLLLLRPLLQLKKRVESERK